MESASSDLQKKRTATVPPRRGQIIDQIIKSLAETVSSKVKELLSKPKGSVDDGATSHASTTPPPSGYTSGASPNNES